MKRLFDKNQLTFSLIWIGVYVVLLSLADGLSSRFGVEKIITAPLCVVMTLVLFNFIKSSGLMAYCGLKKGGISPKSWLYFLPLALLASTNFWGGVALNMTVLETVLYILAMLCVGFLEEVIFRGLLFNALRKDNLVRAVIISSLTFGIGHIINLLNGAEVLATLLQIVYATAAGFLFTVIFLCSGSLLPCIITHSAINSFSAVTGRSSRELDIAAAVVLTVVSVSYGLWILKKHPITKQE